MLARRPSIFVAPLLGAVVALVLSTIGEYFTDPLGGLGSGLFIWVAFIGYSFAFGVAIIQADAMDRGLKATFDFAWEEARRKAAGIVLAAIGFWFVVFVAQWIGSLIGIAALYGLVVFAAFFLIYTIPASAIGGLPGSLALGGSIRAVRASPVGSAVLAAAFVALFLVGAPLLAVYLQVIFHLDAIIGSLIVAVVRAVTLAYLAFPFARQYSVIAFR